MFKDITYTRMTDLCHFYTYTKNIYISNKTIPVLPFNYARNPQYF